MDRTAWVAVVLSAVGLVIWYAYMAKQAAVRPNPAFSSAQTSPAGASLAPSPSAGISSTPSPLPSIAAAPSASPAPSVAAFTEARETLRNSDVELHLTNRGGAIA